MMDRATAIFADGIGAAAATSGVLNQLQGRIFGFLYLQQRPHSLDEIALALEQSKSNVSVNIRGLAECISSAWPRSAVPARITTKRRPTFGG